MEEKQAIIASGLENTSLTQFSNNIHDLKKNTFQSTLILGTNKKQGTDSLIEMQKLYS